MKITGQSEQFNSRAGMLRELRTALDKPGWTVLKMSFGGGNVETQEFTREQVEAIYQVGMRELPGTAVSKPKQGHFSTEHEAVLKAQGWTFKDKKDPAEPI